MKTIPKLILAMCVVAIMTPGCSSPPPENAPSSNAQNSTSDDGHDHSHDDGHDHSHDDGHDHSHDDAHAAGHQAPHGGILVEIGRDHAYHAEVVEDHDAGRLRVYVLGAEMEVLKTDATSVTIVLTAGETTRSFELEKSTDDDQVDVFQSSDADLLKMFDGGPVQGKLRVSLGGTPYSGSFSHDHDHDHEDHDHEDHDHEDHDHD